MNVTDIPAAVKPELYDEAAAAYAQLVQPRAISVYRSGNIRYPGLCDLDLIVVTDKTGIDNRYFFSAMQRLPRKYLPVFLHEPFILPVWSMRVIQHTAHASPVLLAGREVLGVYKPATEDAERWCRMLASYCSYSRFAAQARESGELHGRMTLSIAHALRFLLAGAPDFVARDAAAEYGGAIDRVREHFFDGDPECGVREAWRIFSEGFDRFDAALREWLGVAEPRAALAKAIALLRGEEACDAFEREYAFRRARSIDGYHQELASLGFPYGHLFFIAAHPGAVRTPAQTSPVTHLVRHFYSVRRRLAEYGAGA